MWLLTSTSTTLAAIGILFLSLAAFAQSVPPSPAAIPAATYDGRILLPDGTAATGVRVALYDSANAPTPPPALDNTDAQGHFTLRSPADRAALVVQASGCGLFVLGLSPSSVDGPLEIQLKAATTIHIHIVGPDNKPLPGVRVGLGAMRELFTVVTGAGALPVELRDRLTQTTDQDGACLFTDMPQRTSLLFRPFDPQYIGENTEVRTGDTAFVDAQPIRLQKGMYIEGRVVRADTHQPVPALTISDHFIKSPGTATANGLIDIVHTDSEGKFRLGQLSPGQHTLMTILTPPLSTQLAARASDPINVIPGQNVSNIELQLVSGTILQGKAGAAGTGDPIAGAAISVGKVSGSGSDVAGTITNADGGYSVCLLPGEYTVGIRNLAAHGFLLPVPNGRRVTVDQTGDMSADFSCLPYPRLAVKGRVVDDQGQPVAGADVTATPPGIVGGSFGSLEAIAQAAEQSGGSGITDADGRFSLPFVTDHAVLRVRKVDLRMTAPVTIDADHRDLQLTLKKTPSGSLLVQVVDQAARPLAGVQVLLTWLPPGETAITATHWKSGISSADGTFSAGGLYTDCNYTITAGGDHFTSKQTRDIKVRANQETQVPSIQILKADSFIAGKVVDTTGQPIAGATVQVTSSGVQPATARTGLDGGFRIDGIVAGSTVNVRTRVDGRLGSAQGKRVAAGVDNLVLVHAPDTSVGGRNPLPAR